MCVYNQARKAQIFTCVLIASFNFFFFDESRKATQLITYLEKSILCVRTKKREEN